jgi:hypothetical protein
MCFFRICPVLDQFRRRMTMDSPMQFILDLGEKIEGGLGVFIRKSGLIPRRTFGSRSAPGRLIVVFFSGCVLRG